MIKYGDIIGFRLYSSGTPVNTALTVKNTTLQTDNSLGIDEHFNSAKKSQDVFWKLVSITGKGEGSPVLFGDTLAIKAYGSLSGYLYMGGSSGWNIHLGSFSETLPEATSLNFPHHTKAAFKFLSLTGKRDGTEISHADIIAVICMEKTEGVTWRVDPSGISGVWANHEIIQAQNRGELSYPINMYKTTGISDTDIAKFSRFRIFSKTFLDINCCVGAGINNCEESVIDGCTNELIEKTCLADMNKCRGKIMQNFGKYDDLVQKYCKDNLDDEMCACYRPPPESLKSVLGELLTLPYCWNSECAIRGYRNSSLKVNTACPNIKICKSVINAQNSKNLNMDNVKIQENCNAEVTVPDQPPEKKNNWKIILVVLFVFLVLLSFIIKTLLPKNSNIQYQNTMYPAYNMQY